MSKYEKNLKEWELSSNIAKAGNWDQYVLLREKAICFTSEAVQESGRMRTKIIMLYYTDYDEELDI